MPRRSSESALQSHGSELFALLQELLRAYQFRDVDTICAHGVTLTECHLLDLLAGAEGFGVNELASRLGLDKSTVSRAVARLEGAKLIRKRARTEDARASELQLTAAGRRKHERIVEGSVASYAKLLRPMPAGERDAMIAEFRRLVALLAARKR